jgi:hypothetical protein
MEHVAEDDRLDRSRQTGLVQFLWRRSVGLNPHMLRHFEAPVAESNGVP